uniref:NADH dehydrogenase subunit 2 n=1 Tax=Orosius sp. TaxID=2974349 RepID=UPI002181FA19|nr:NADH dehydrogenase subunit 2 [Orosius sp.]UVI59893.1 NADH dehydrogenase subunit 2 [Orosius sp.]
MWFNSTKILLSNTMMMGVIMVICSNNWISMWSGLEIMMLSFMPFMQNENQLSSESMMKYFITQSIASTLFLLGISIMLVGDNMMVIEMIMTTSMLIKLGSAPFHNWVMLVIEPLKTLPITVLLTIMKVPPLLILHQIESSLLVIPTMMGMLTAISCINQSSVRKIMGYSSVYNMSLMLVLIKNLILTYTFIVIYSTMLTMFMLLAKNMKISHLNQLVFNEFNPWIKINLFMNMLSMAGFPPLMGFFNKIMTMQILINENNMILIMIMSLTSMLVMMFYMRMTFSTIITLYSFKKWVINSNNTSYFNMILNMTLLPIMFSNLSLVK